MENRRHIGSTVGSGKYWLASGVVAAGLGAAMLAATGAAAASTGEAGSAGDAATRTSTDRSEQASQNTVGDGVAQTGSRSEPAGEAQADGAGRDDDDEHDDDLAIPDEDQDALVGDSQDNEDRDDSDTGDEAGDVNDDDQVVEVVEVVDVEDLADPEPEDSGGAEGGSDVDDSAEVTTPAPAARKETDRGEADGQEVLSGAAVSTDSAAARVAMDSPATTAVAQTVATTATASPARITVGSMIVDMLYSLGIRDTGLGADFLAIPVPRFIESWWQGVRTRIYRDVVPEPEPEPDPGSGAPTDPTDPPDSAEPELLWESNFTDMTEALQHWGLQTGRWGAPAGENQYYTDGDNVYIDADGNLVIDARREATPDGLGAPHNYTSARVVTYGKQSVGVGTRVVARIQMPVTQGSLPAFWSVGLEPGHEFDWPRQGEIDIVEIPGLGTPQSRRVWTGNIHGPADTDNSVDVKLHGVDADLGVDLSQGFHEYGMDWYADRIVWHVDGVEVGSVTQAQYEALGGDWTPFSGAWDHYLILNVAVGNPWTGDPDPATPFQAQMKVDWVKAYQL